MEIIWVCGDLPRVYLFYRDGREEGGFASTMYWYAVPGPMWKEEEGGGGGKGGKGKGGRRGEEVS